MGLFDTLSSIGKTLIKTAQNASMESYKRQESVRGSAIPPGRMRETDVVKGKKCNIPHEPGMYRHVNKETGKVEYAGQTNDLRKRQQEHARDGKLDTSTQKVAYSTSKPNATKDNLLKTEKEHIKRHDPSGNTYAGGNGRR